MPYPVPNYWIVSGTLNKNGIPFYEGKVYADNLKNGVFQTIAETGISSDGSFTLGFSSSQFQDQASDMNGYRLTICAGSMLVQELSSDFKLKCLRYFINQIQSDESHIGANAIAYLATNENIDEFEW